MRVLPTLDQYSDQKVSPEVSRILDVKGCEQFVAAHPEYYASPHNHAAIQKWLVGHRVPWSLWNFEVAFSELSKDGVLESHPEISSETHAQIALTLYEKGVRKMDSQSTFKNNFPVGTDAERQLAAEGQYEESFIEKIEERRDELTELRSLSDIGKPVSPELKQRYRNSLGRTDLSRPPLPVGWASARRHVRFHRPDLKPDSAAFNAECARLIAESQ